MTPQWCHLFLKEETMKKDENLLIGVLTMVVLSSIFMNKANALSPENNLSNNTTIVSSTAKAVFLVSKPKSLTAVPKDINTLAKYQDATSLSDRQLKDLLRAVGFKGQGLKNAWAIAKRESNGQPIRFNGNTKTGDNSYGLFQINMIGNLNPDRKAKFGINYTSDLLNPVINAQIAYHMSKGGYDWTAWHGMTPRAKTWLKKYPA